MLAKIRKGDCARFERAGAGLPVARDVRAT